MTMESDAECSEGKECCADMDHLLKQAGEVLGLNAKDVKQFLEPEEVHEAPFTVNLGGSERELNAIRVRHNSRRGPTKGGMRFHPSLDLEEAKRLAFLMTWKCSLAGLPFGGGKGGVNIDVTELDEKELQSVAEGCLDACQKVVGYNRDVWGPDMGTNPHVMEAFVQKAEQLGLENPQCITTGKPLDQGGLEGRAKATAFGGKVLLRPLLGDKIGESRFTVAIQGLGNVGAALAQFCSELGCSVVALADSSATVSDSSGLDIEAVLKHKKDGKKLRKFNGEISESKEILEAKADLLVLAASGDQIDDKNVQQVQAGAILEMANGGISPAAEELLLAGDVQIFPDLLVNAGGVIASYFEWRQNCQGKRFSLEQVEKKLEEKMLASWQRTSKRQEVSGIPMRLAAYVEALQGVLDPTR